MCGVCSFTQILGPRGGCAEYANATDDRGPSVGEVRAAAPVKHRWSGARPAGRRPQLRGTELSLLRGKAAVAGMGRMPPFGWRSGKDLGFADDNELDPKVSTGRATSRPFFCLHAVSPVAGWCGT